MDSIALDEKISAADGSILSMNETLARSDSAMDSIALDGIISLTDGSTLSMNV